MHIHRSNRTEELALALAEVTRVPLPSPLSPEVVVVSSQGMERWLTQSLSTRFGVWMNARFPFPRAFIDELLAARVREGADGPKTLSREALTWAIFDLLPSISGLPGAEALASYLADGDDGTGRFEIARQVEGAFDQYAVYRPELVLAWERGAGRGWQPDLWRALAKRHGPLHLAKRAAQFLANEVPSAAPLRVSIFGASALPRIYAKILAHLARARDVHVFLLCPSTDRTREHPLAASLGTLGRDFEDILRDEAPGATVVDRFVEVKPKTMLEVVQTDLFSGRTRKAGSPESPRVVATPGDASIVVHSCHSALREVEALRDQLLAAFEDDRTLEPRDVIVMAADIDVYAPLIDAVFGISPDEPGFIPYRIADRKLAASNLAAEALFSLLELAGSRMRASDVLDFVQLDPVRQRYGIAEEQLTEVRRLVRESGIRWGIDAEHRRAVGQPARQENTWRFGLGRLLLGQVMGPDDDPYSDVVPVFGRGGESAELIGKLSELLRVLFDSNARLERPQTPAEWRATLDSLLSDFVPSGEPFTASVRAVRTTLDRLFHSAAEVGFERPIHRRVVTALLRATLGGDRGARSFLAGGVTFSALLPMRSVPFRVVCMLGLNDRDFPRHDPKPAFDLVTHRREVGDRSAREEDRQLFLEALLSARERLWLFYDGRAIQDNAELPPSVVVSELLDALESSFTTIRDPSNQLALPIGASIRPRVVVEHPLQPFSPLYFGADPRLFSFVEADAEGARALERGNAAPSKFHVAPLLGPKPGHVDLDDLVRFLENPARGLIQRRLGVVLDDDPILVSNREPIELGPLPTYEVGARLFAEALRRPELGSPLIWARGLGALPLGAPGELDAERVLAEVLELHRRAATWVDGGRLAAIEVDLPLEGASLTGLLRDVYPNAQVFVRFARLKARNEVAAWVRHLALCSVSGARSPRTTVVIGRGSEPGKPVEARVFLPLMVEVARTFLRQLVSFYEVGQRAPLCLFPAASKRFVQALTKGEGELSALVSAKRTFSSSNPGADGDDAYVRQLFEGENPFDPLTVPFDELGDLGLPSFASLARAVFEPILAASEGDAK